MPNHDNIKIGLEKNYCIRNTTVLEIIYAKPLSPRRYSVTSSF